MFTLTLFRHAKSSWDDPSLPDKARPLSDRGRKAAPRMGAFLAEAGLIPDLVLCSTAVRTRETLALALPEMGLDPGCVRFDDALYLAAPKTILARVAALASDAVHVMVVAHDPGLHELGVGLAGGGDRRALAAMRAKFSTGAVAVIDLPGARTWGDVSPGTGSLRLFVTPRTLPLPSQER